MASPFGAALARSRRLATNLSVALTWPSVQHSNLIIHRRLAGTPDNHDPQKVFCLDDSASQINGKEEQLCMVQASPNAEKEHGLENALNQILSVIKTDSVSCRVMSTAFISKLCEVEDMQSVNKLLQLLHDEGIFLGQDTYSLILAAGSKRSDIDTSTKAFKQLLLLHEPLSSESYLNVVKAFAKAPDSAYLLRFLEEVCELTFPRSTIIINRIIFFLAQCGQIDKALSVFNHIHRLKCQPDLVTYNTILDIFGRIGCLDEMLYQFASMKEAGIVPDTITYNTVLNGLRKVGGFNITSTIWREMKERGVEPDLLTYTALIESFGRSGNVDQSLRLFEEMKQKHFRPSVHIYRSLIHNLKKMGKVELAAALLEELNSSQTYLAGPKDFKRKKG